MLKLAIILLAVSANAQEGATQIDRWAGLNDTDSSAVISSREASDLLNTESNLEGTALLKRRGFTREAALTVATAPVTGAFLFTNDSGDNITIVCHDRYCSSSVNGAAFTNFLSTAGGTGAIPVRWSFVTIDGDLYGANTRRDPILRYDGSTLSYPTGPPAGSVLALTEDRLVVTDTAANPNRVAYSQSGTYTTFATGAGSTDPWTDDIGSPGDRNTSIVYNRGRLFIFKRRSITSCLVGDQYTTRCTVISDNVGTLDPNSIVSAPDGIYFVSTDGPYWKIDESGLTLISQKISTFVRNKSVGSSRSNTQTTQVDWEAGSERPANTWDTVTRAGSIFTSSSTLIDGTTAQFALGTFAGSAINPNGYVQFAGVTSTYVFRYDANVLPTSDGWTRTGTPTSESVSGSSLTVDGANNVSARYSRSFTANTLLSQMFVFRAGLSVAAINGNFASFSIRNSAGTRFAEIRISSSSVTYATTTVAGNELLSQLSYSTYTVIISSASGVHFYRDGVFRASGTVATTGTNNTANFEAVQPGVTFIDFFHISSGVIAPGIVDIPTISTFTSRIFDTSYTTPTFGPIAITSYPVAGTTLSYSLRTSTSANNDLWGAYESIGNNSRPVSYTNRYAQYSATFTHLNLTASPGISRSELPIATTGQFRTQCIQPGTGITSWGTFSCAQTNIGGGSEVFLATSAATCAALPTTDPTSWQTGEINNATLTISTNAAMYLGWRSLLGSSTDQAQVDACTIYWNEGVPAQPVWGVYDSFKNSIFWTATTTAASSGQGDRLLKYDLNLGYFYPFDIRATALVFNNNSVYFGGATGGFWNRYGQVGTDSDNGTSINAFWRSKDFSGLSPFQETTFQKISLVARNQITGSLTATHTTSNNSSTSYTVSLATTSGINYVRSNYTIPLKSPHNFINVRLGNNSSTPFEILGLRIDYLTQPWKVANP